jgi:hypothetical protein
VLAQGSVHGFVPANVCTVRNAYAAVELGQADTDCNGVEDNADDDDQDGIFNDADNCRNTSNPSQRDFDHDGVGDVCDADADADGIPDAVDKCPGLATTWYENQDSDGDGTGRGCDGDNDNDGVPDDGAPGDMPCAFPITQGCDDNCIDKFNSSQFDGNNNGRGDACDPDRDGDGYYVESDNCTFVTNPTQTDNDNDGIGDACDKCPNVADNMGAYTAAFPELGILPEPLQPDEDGDGIPDACETYTRSVTPACHGRARSGTRANRCDPTALRKPFRLSATRARRCAFRSTSATRARPATSAVRATSFSSRSRTWRRPCKRRSWTTKGASRVARCARATSWVHHPTGDCASSRAAIDVGSSNSRSARISPAARTSP